MEKVTYDVDTESYAKCIQGSKRIRWDIDKDVLRGRTFDFSKKFLPDGLTKLDMLDFLNEQEKTFLSQIQGRTYANMFGFVERFIVAKILEVARDHCLGDQVALEALIRFCDEELKHQELFRRVEQMIGDGMPEGYQFTWDPNKVAAAVLEKSTWAVLALIYEIELFTQEHYKQSIEPDEYLSELYKDIFLFHWKEEAHHAVMDGLEWPRIDKTITDEERDQAIDEVIELVKDVDSILQTQAKVDTQYFVQIDGQRLNNSQIDRVQESMLGAYRWQYIFSGVEHPRYQGLISQLISEPQGNRLNNAFAPLS